MTSKSKLWSFIFIIILGAIILSPVIVNAEYTYRKAITIDHTKVSATLANFPVLVSISNDNDLKNHVTSANGYDLVFKDGSGTKLNHEIERWDGLTGTLAAWVRIPSLSSTADTVIYIWYGDSGVTTSQENKTGVWDSNFKGVWHLPNGTNLTTNDSTSNANNGTNNGATANAGMVDGAGGFNGSSSFVSAAHNSSLQPQNITLEIWIKPAVNLTTGSYGPFIRKDGNDVNAMGQGYNFCYYSTGTRFWVGNGSNTWVGAYYTVNLAAGTWYHVVATYDGAALRTYLNGIEVANNPWTGGIGYGTYANPFYIGYLYGNSVGNRYFNGTIDEVRISNVARSANWILTEYRNQGSPSTFYTVGNETQTFDTTAPVVTAFVIPSLYNNLTVPITTFTATDNIGVTGYLLTELSSTPSLSDSHWSATPQTQYIFSSGGNKTLYAWAKDSAGNISNSFSATVVVVARWIYVYDELNRLIQVIYEDGSRVTYTYDAVGNRLGTEVQVIDTTPPTTTASPPGGTYALGQTITLSCNDGSGSGCDKIYYTTDGSTPTTSSLVYSAPINISATTTLKFFAKDLSGNSEAVKNQTYTMDTTPPTGTISINSGAAYTTSTNVTLTLSCSDAQGCAQMQFSNDNVTYSTAEAYATSKARVLTSGDGTKSVYVKFKDTPGNWSSAYSNTILLDTTAPTTTASPAGGTYNSAQSVTLSCNDGTGSGCDKIYYTTDGSTPTTSSPIYSSPINISVTTTLKFFARDLAGNSEVVKSETYTISTNMVTVQLKDSTGNPLSGGVVQYYSGGWQAFGTTDASGRVSKGLQPGTYSFSMTYGFARQEKSQNVATNPTVIFQTTKVTIELRDSSNNLIDPGTVQYYSGGWRDIGNTSGGQISKELLPLTYTFSMTYGYARQEKSQNIATNPTVVFQTTKVTIELRDSTGALMDTGTVQYYSGGWRDIGSTSGGQVTKELLSLTYTFSMTYGFARQEKSQNVATNPTVVFQTTNVAIQLKDSTGALLDTGTVQYYSGGWRDIGNTSGGQVTKELLPLTYTFSMTYGFGRQEKSQNTATNSTVVFQTTRVTVQLKDSTGALMDTGTVQYYSGGWRDIGGTSGGQVTKELLPLTYTFSMTYGFARQEKSQNTATNPTVVFQTTKVTIELRDSTGALMDTGTVQYYSGGWRDIGSTSGGQVTKELLPLTYTFSMTYGFARQEKSQNTATNSTVVFQTGQVQSDSGSCTNYYAGGWRTFIQDMELLPATYTFRFNDGTPDTSYTMITGTVNHIH